MKKRQQCTLVSAICRSLCAVSSFLRYPEYWSLICKQLQAIMISMRSSDSEYPTLLGAYERPTYRVIGSQHPSLLSRSPYPGVSMILSLSLTAFSTIATRKAMISPESSTESPRRSLRLTMLRLLNCCRLRDRAIHI
jgi:hypothetical protein